MNCFPCSVEVIGLFEDRSLNTATAVVTHDDDVVDFEFGHTVGDDGDGVEVSSSVLVRDVSFGEKDTRGRREICSFGNSRVTG